MNNGTHIKNGVMYSGGANEADQIAYDNTASGLEATNTQEAIDEINSDLSELATNKVDTSKFVVWFGNITTGAFGEFATGYSANDYICIGAFQSSLENYQVDMYIGSNGRWCGRVHAFNDYSQSLASRLVSIRLLMYKHKF